MAKALETLQQDLAAALPAPAIAGLDPPQHFNEAGRGLIAKKGAMAFA